MGPWLASKVNANVVPSCTEEDFCAKELAAAPRLEDLEACGLENEINRLENLKK
jgi:hypothetical protein